MTALAVGASGVRKAGCSSATGDFLTKYDVHRRNLGPLQPAGMRKYRSLPGGSANGSARPKATNAPPAGFCAMLKDAGGRAMSETRKLAAILVSDVVGYSRLAGCGRRSNSRSPSDPSQRPDRPNHRRAPWAHRQAHRRRQHRRVPQRGRRSELRHRSPKGDGRAQRRGRARQAHRISDRHPSRRCGRGERRRPDGRRRQYRRAVGRESPSPERICISEDAYRQVKSRLELKVTDLGPGRSRTSSSLCAPTRWRSVLRRKAKPAWR